MGWEERSFLEEGRREGKAEAKTKLRHRPHATVLFGPSDQSIPRHVMHVLGL